LGNDIQDKAKPFVRGGQKATGLIIKMAELLKERDRYARLLYLVWRGYEQSAHL